MKKIIVSLAIFLLSQFALAQSWEELNEQGISLYQAGKYSEATIIFAGQKLKNQQGSKERSLSQEAWVSRISKQQRFFDALSGSVTYLPGTKNEVETIQKIAQENNIFCKIYLENDANEENLKKLVSPTILHIATHGFFIEEQKQNRNSEEKKFDNPLLRSGILLAEAELTLNEKPTSNKENGIVLAQEALNLNLQGTELVVLSACETGLGEVKAGEGVFGLQRSFQEAGAKSILMSLWKVDDYATQELMTLFYENLLQKKQPKRLAFQNAQNALKEKYIYPYYWGAFVMVGE